MGKKPLKYNFYLLLNLAGSNQPDLPFSNEDPKKPVSPDVPEKKRAMPLQ